MNERWIAVVKIIHGSCFYFPSRKFRFPATMEFFRLVDRRNFAYEARCFLEIAHWWKDPIIFLDTEFPGSPHQSKKPYSLLSPVERYALLKQNVDDIRPIQVGITLCHRASRAAVVWQFDLCDFDVRCHPQAPESIDLLESSGIDLELTRHLGVPSLWIAGLLLDARLVGPYSAATWVAFHGGYDFAILLKALLQKSRRAWYGMEPAKLPETLDAFTKLTRTFFKSSLYDLKCLLKCCGGGSKLRGGLESVAARLKVDRLAGNSHQAGSDSLLTCQVFSIIKELYFSNGDENGEENLPCEGILFGLEGEES